MRAEQVRSLLLVAADPAERRRVAAVAGQAGWSVLGAFCAQSGAALLQGPHGREVQAVLLGSWDEQDGPQQIVALRDDRPSLPVIVLAGEGSVGQAVAALRAGASDFLVRPVAAERLLEALAAHSDRRQASGELAPLAEKLTPTLSLDELVGAAPNLRIALAVAAKAARSRSPILILGEPGSGKETIARAIHAASWRMRGPFVALDCRAIPANIIDSVLFGHERGAFPGAFDERVGKLVEAHGGTLLLDEIGALPFATQRLLDDVLATGEVRPVGRNGSNSVSVRLISTTSRPLPDPFHPGLAARIGATSVVIPPLRERSGDIPALARHLLARIADQQGTPLLSIGNDALAVLMRYGWPGNVRQLNAVLFRAALHCQGPVLTAEDFPHIAFQSRFTGRIADRQSPPSKSSSDAALAGAPAVTLFGSDGHLRLLEEIEADVIRLAIGHYRGRMTEVARRLGIGRSTLYRKLGELGIDNAA